MLEWTEVTAENRPPQNKEFLWCMAMPESKDDESPVFWRIGAVMFGVYRFGLVECPSGKFSLPPIHLPDYPVKRVWWAEINLPCSPFVIE